MLWDDNQRVVTERRRPTFEKASPVLAPTADVEALVEQWRELRAARAPAPHEEAGTPPSPARAWWRRLLRR